MKDFTGKRLPALDGLRGVAILVVLITHGMQSWGQAYDRGINAVVDTGWIALDIFFVLSGFLITGILLHTRGTAGFFRVFYARRALRIFPLYYAYCLVLFGIVPLLVPYRSVLYSSAPWYLSFLVSIPLTLHGANSGAPYASFFWSLAVEEQFYLLWPFLVARLTTKALRRVCLLTILIAFLARIAIIGLGYPWGAYLLLPCRMGALACGAWLAIAHRESPEQLGHAKPWFLVCGACVLTIIFKERTGWFLTAGMATIGSTIVTFMCSSLLVIAISGRRLSSVLSSPVLLFLAKYSYALYVFDNVAVKLAYSVVGSSGSLAARTGRLLLSVTFNIPMALASWHLLEKRFIALQRYFPYGAPGRRHRQQLREPDVQPALAGIEVSDRALA